MSVNPYKGIPNLKDFIDQKIGLPAIPLNYIVIPQSQWLDQEQSRLIATAQQSGYPQYRSETSLRDQNSCCWYIFFPAIQIIICIVRASQMIFAASQMPIGIIWGVSAFFFLVGVCFVCTNRPAKKYRTLMKIFLFSLVVDLIGLAYAIIYFATHLDEDDCQQNKIQDPNVVNNQVNSCNTIDNHYWLYYSLIFSGVIYGLSLIIVIAFYCNNKTARGNRGTQYTLTQNIEMQPQ